MSRLLSELEIQGIIKGISRAEGDHAIAKAQQELDFKAVGKWLEKRIVSGTENYLMLKGWDKEAFKRGELPE